MVGRTISRLTIAAVLLALPSTTFALTSSDLTRIAGTNAADGLGRAVASGDLNGDGYDEIIAGAPVNATGYISITYGSSTLPTDTTVSTSNSVVITGNGSTDSFGGVIAVGDIDGDGYDDIAVSATADTQAGASNSGAVYIIYGSETNLSSAAVTAQTSFAKFINGVGFQTGTSVSIGNINGDEYDDVMISSPNDAPNGGSVAIVYGQATQYSGTSNGLTSLPRFTGESGGNAFGRNMAVGDVNADGYDDLFVTAPLRNSVGGNGAGSGYIFYGQSASYSGATNASTVAEFSGEAENDNAGSGAYIGDVDGDGYEDIMVSAASNDDGATGAGAVYVIPGSATNYTSSVSLSTFTEFTGATASDGLDRVFAYDTDGDDEKEVFIGGRVVDANNGIAYMFGSVSTSASVSDASLIINGASTEQFGSSFGRGDINGDGFEELLIGARAHNSSAGSVLVAAFLIDADGDGVIGSGLITEVDSPEPPTVDCNDEDSTVTAEATYYVDADADGLGAETSTTSVCSSTAPEGYADNTNDTNDAVPNNGVEIDGDGVDNDEDGQIDEHNTTDNEHPYYGSLSPTETEAVAVNITSVEGAAAGVITVTYADGSVYDYTVLTTTTAKTTLVQQYKQTGYGIVLDRKGKSIKLVNLYNGDIASSKTLSSKSTDKASLLLKDVRNDNKTEAVVTTLRNKKAGLYIVKVSSANATLKVKDSATVESKKVATNKTKVKKSLVSLRTKTGNVVASFKVNKKYQLIAQQ